MPFVALMCPAAVSVILFRKRRGYKPGVIDSVIAYLIFTLLINIFTACTALYIFKINDPVQELLNGFSFFTKYVLTALVFAFILPAAYDLLKKLFKVSFDDKPVPGSKADEK